MRQLEHALQRAIHRYLKLAVPQPRAIWAVDHARKSSMIEAVRLKERGCISGIHDMFCLWGGQLITLEIKVGRNDATPGQNEFADAVIAAGGLCFLVRCIEDVEAALRSAGVPVLASAQGRDEKLAVWQAKPKRASRPRAKRDDPAAIRRMMRPGGSADRDPNLVKNRTLV